MDELIEWLKVLTRLSTFFIAVVSAMVALLIRDLLEPRQWQRYVRKVVASALSGILVFVIIATGYILLFQRISEDSLLAQSVALVVGLGIIPATILAAVLAFQRVEPVLDWYMSSRFFFFFQNGSWPALSIGVRSECLPENATYIKGHITAVRGNVGEYHLSVVVGIRSDVRIVLDETTRNPWQGWMRVMRAVLKAQLGDPQVNRVWQDRIHMYSKLRDRFKSLTRTPPENAAARHNWQNEAYMQIHRLARRMDARDVTIGHFILPERNATSDG